MPDEKRKPLIPRRISFEIHCIPVSGFVIDLVKSINP